MTAEIICYGEFENVLKPRQQVNTFKLRDAYRKSREFTSNSKGTDSDLAEGVSDDHFVASSFRFEKTGESLAKKKSAVEGHAKELRVVWSHAKEEWAEEGPTPLSCLCADVAALSLFHSEDIDCRVLYGGRSLVIPED
ncbi:unnamed protein product [Schistocephalus solidus]|uniref:Uncharacterized protein n=1 Tax=Schistocephalus solidus TaxID=70667 RepID=A0A183T961_SCHSO|nr:unnamed protein product [Schistocephalus solidus]